MSKKHLEVLDKANVAITAAIMDCANVAGTAKKGSDKHLRWAAALDSLHQALAAVVKARNAITGDVPVILHAMKVNQAPDEPED